jgi:8-oxo-dGTP diphosphatase
MQTARVGVVVAAAIVRDGRVLAARRSAPPQLAGGWEFPGGKVEPGESDADALRRECAEELGVEVAVGRLLAEAAIRHGLTLRVYRATLESGEPVAMQDHDDLRWLGAADVDDVAWLRPDRPAVAAIGHELRRP